MTKPEVVEHVARAMRPLLFNGTPDDKVGPVTLYERNACRQMAERAIAALTIEGNAAELVTSDAAWLRKLAELMAKGHRFTEGKAHASRIESIAARLSVTAPQDGEVKLRARIASLEAALSTTHKLIYEFAKSGFTDHDLGMALFRNQGNIHAALNPPPSQRVSKP